MAWQLTHTARTMFPFVKGGNERRNCTPALLQQQQWQHRVPAAAAASGNGSEGPLSFEDDADSGLSKLRYNKRPSELPKELQGAKTATCCATDPGSACPALLQAAPGTVSAYMGYQATSAKQISEIKLQLLVTLLGDEADAYQQLTPAQQQQQQPWHTDALLRRHACIVQY